jgi:hypothetical protein
MHGAKLSGTLNKLRLRLKDEGKDLVEVGRGLQQNQPKAERGPDERR